MEVRPGPGEAAGEILLEPAVELLGRRGIPLVPQLGRVQPELGGRSTDHGGGARASGASSPGGSAQNSCGIDNRSYDRSVALANPSARGMGHAIAGCRYSISSSDW